MRKKILAKSAKEFDSRFDAGEDIHNLIDMSKATVVHHGKKVRITLDISESLVNEIDNIRRRIGVDRGALNYKRQDLIFLTVSDNVLSSSSSQHF
jgi:hypothetical protein